MMKLFILMGLLVTSVFAEVVYVETPFDTDGDGKNDRIYVKISGVNGGGKVSSLIEMSPYNLGGTNVPMHNVDVDYLPQDEAELKKLSLNHSNFKSSVSNAANNLQLANTARLSVDSLGTGRSSGCPTVGDKYEALAGKAVIDWLNGRATAYSQLQGGQEVKADWSNGKAGMSGVSYNGTLPTMVASTGVEGLVAIMPIAAISNWYDYYRANGLVVGPGGYIGEDADILGYYIVRRGRCQAQMEELTRIMGREHGDHHSFWDARNYLPYASNFKAATFIVHGQSDWNVKQKHAIQLFEALKGKVPLRMWLHPGGHGYPYNSLYRKLRDAWFNYHLNGVYDEVLDLPSVHVEVNRSVMAQNDWPHEKTVSTKVFFNENHELSGDFSKYQASLVDRGKKVRVRELIKNPNVEDQARLAYLTHELDSDLLISGTPEISLKVSLENRKGANLTVVIIEYGQNGQTRIITRGWADPQNYKSIAKGELLNPGQVYPIQFKLEPKQAILQKGSRLGVVLLSTDYEYTLRPDEGTKMNFHFDETTYLKINSAPSLF